MTELQITLVQRTFRYLLPIGDTVAALFYARLLQLDPALSPAMKRGDLKASGRNLIQTLAVAVQSLRDLARVQSVLEDCGREHAVVGLSPAHYDTMGRAWLDTMHVALGDAFARDVYDAWGAALKEMAPMMQKGAAHPESRP
ncbi:MAG: globin domain-containing protein [Casimicrobiaceae bacterium]